MGEHTMNVTKKVNIVVTKVGKKHRAQVYDSGILKRVSWRRTYDDALAAAATWVEKNYEVNL
jgi:hypothetical protein